MSESNTYSFKNVLLETGFEYDEQEVIRTKTRFFCVEIENNKIKSVTPNNPNAKAVDAKGHLMLPAFRDTHIHIDKTLFGLPWKTVSQKGEQ